MHKEKPDIIIFHILHSLRGIPLPSAKKQIVEYARKSGADNGAIDWLGRIPDQEYRSERDIANELRRVAA